VPVVEDPASIQFSRSSSQIDGRRKSSWQVSRGCFRCPNSDTFLVQGREEKQSVLVPKVSGLQEATFFGLLAISPRFVFAAYSPIVALSWHSPFKSARSGRSAVSSIPYDSAEVTAGPPFSCASWSPALVPKARLLPRPVQFPVRATCPLADRELV